MLLDQAQGQRMIIDVQSRLAAARLGVAVTIFEPYRASLGATIALRISNPIR